MRDDQRQTVFSDLTDYTIKCIRREILKLINIENNISGRIL